MSLWILYSVNTSSAPVSSNVIYNGQYLLYKYIRFINYCFPQLCCFGFVTTSTIMVHSFLHVLNIEFYLIFYLINPYHDHG